MYTSVFVGPDTAMFSASIAEHDGRYLVRLTLRRFRCGRRTASLLQRQACDLTFGVRHPWMQITVGVRPQRRELRVVRCGLPGSPRVS
jgi:hypothetical protein